MPGYLTAKQMLDKAAAGIREEDVEFAGGKVRVRGLTAAEDALVTEGSIKVAEGRGRSTRFRASLRQRLMLQYGLLEPRLDAAEIERLCATSGADDIGRVVAKIEELSGTSDEDRDAAAAAFQGSE